MSKLSKRVVDAAQPATKEYFRWDSELPGFGLRVFPSGRKTYVIQCRVQRRTRRFTLGAHGRLTPHLARKEALQKLAEISRGGDPARDKRENSRDLTISELCDLYLLNGCSGKKQTTFLVDRGRIKHHIKPLLGKLSLMGITRSDIEGFRQDVASGKSSTDIKTGPRGRAIVKGGEGTAARTLGLLGAIFSFGISRNLRQDNPVHGVKRRRDAPNALNFSGLRNRLRRGQQELAN